MNNHQAQWNTRAEQPSDLVAIRAVNTAAFATTAEADLVNALRTDPAWIEDLSMVAVDDEGAVVGHALMTRCHIGDVPALCLAPCTVLPGAQRSGAGSEVIRDVLPAAKHNGEDFVVVLGHPEYYSRFGLKRASLRGVKLSIEVPDDALMVLSLDGRPPVPAGVVKYAAPFGI